MNTRDLFLLADLLDRNRDGQRDVYIRPGYGAAAERLQRAGWISVRNGMAQLRGWPEEGLGRLLALTQEGPHG